MALKIIDYGSKEYQQMVKLRDDILRKPLGLGLSDEELEIEKTNMFIGAFEEDDMLGCCMLVEKEYFPSVIYPKSIFLHPNNQIKKTCQTFHLELKK